MGIQTSVMTVPVVLVKDVVLQAALLEILRDSDALGQE